MHRRCCVRVRNVATGKFGSRAAQRLEALAKEERYRYSGSCLVAIRKRMSSAEFMQAQVESNEAHKRNYDALRHSMMNFKQPKKKQRTAKTPANLGLPAWALRLRSRRRRLVRRGSKRPM